MRKVLFLLVLVTAVMINGCKETGCTDPYALNYDPEVEEDNAACTYPLLMLHLHPKVGSDDFAYNTTYTVNGKAVQFTLAQFYMSGLHFGGIDLMLDDTYLLVKADQHMYSIGAVRAGQVTSVGFDIGVDSAANHADPLTQPSVSVLAPQSPSMHWNWNLGYVFMIIEGRVDRDGDGTPESDFVYHIGTDDYLTHVHQDTDFNINTESYMINMDVNYANFLARIDWDSDTDLDTHTMNNPTLAQIIMSNANSVFTVQ